jgi:SpoU rRNA methylase family enzyme
MADDNMDTIHILESAMKLNSMAKAIGGVNRAEAVTPTQIAAADSVVAIIESQCEVISQLLNQILTLSDAIETLRGE